MTGCAFAINRCSVIGIFKRLHPFLDLLSTPESFCRVSTLPSLEHDLLLHIWKYVEVHHKIGGAYGLSLGVLEFVIEDKINQYQLHHYASVPSSWAREPPVTPRKIARLNRCIITLRVLSSGFLSRHSVEAIPVKCQRVIVIKLITGHWPRWHRDCVAGGDDRSIGEFDRRHYFAIESD